MVRIFYSLMIFVVLIVAMLWGVDKANAQINVITVDRTPFGLGGSQTTMGQALVMVDQGGDFNVTEVTPAVFAAMTAAQLSAFDLIAINNSPNRIAGGIGPTWQNVVGVQQCGGRVMLTSHDAPRFHKNFTRAFFAGPGPGPGFAPFGAPDLVRQAALWAGGIPGQTGLLIFNDAPRFQGGSGWDNAELSLPAAWGISDLNAFTNSGASGRFPDGGYTDIIPSPADPVYAGLSDIRFDVNSISSFAANIGDASFHTIFGSFNATIFTPSEVVINEGICDVGNTGVGACIFFGGDVRAAPTPGLDGTPITLIRGCSKFNWDAKLCSLPNAFNCKRTKGVVPVTIFGSAELDVTNIDISSLSLALDSVPLMMTGAPQSSKPPADRGSPVDIDSTDADCTADIATPDGFDDLDVGFNAGEVGTLIGCPLGKGVDSQNLILKGTLLDGTSLEVLNVQILTDVRKK